jgi:hypothetical protein
MSQMASDFDGFFLFRTKAVEREKKKQILPMFYSFRDN